MFLVLLLMSLYGAWRVSKFDLCQTLSFHSVSFILLWDNHGGKVLGSFGTPWICCYNPKLQFFYTSLLAWLKHLTRLCLQQNGLAGPLFGLCPWYGYSLLHLFVELYLCPGQFRLKLVQAWPIYLSFGLDFQLGPQFYGTGTGGFSRPGSLL